MRTATIASGAATGVTSLTFTGADADPDASGEIQYDSTIAEMSGGGLRWYDDDSVRLLVDLESDPSNDDYVVAYDATADGVLYEGRCWTAAVQLRGTILEHLIIMEQRQ